LSADQTWQGRKAVVTGGAGFIGSHVVDALVKKGAEVVVIDNLSTGRIDNLAPVIDRVQFVRASTLETHHLRRAFQGVDTVFHLAAVLGVKRTWEEPIRTIHENVIGTENVLAAAANAGVRRVVHASSSEVYGDGVPPYSEETSPAAPHNGYATAKLLEEKLAEAYHEETGLEVVSLRYFNSYGNGQIGNDYGFVVSIFLQRALAGLPLTIYGDGTQTRDFTNVLDTAEATILSADRAGVNDILNVGTGREVSINDLAKAVLKATGRTDLKLEYAPRRRAEVQRRLCDPAKVRKTLAWEPYWTLERGLEALASGAHK